MAKKEPTGWITVNGQHVPIYEGESKQDAYNRTIAKMNEDKKASDIAKRKAEVDKLNGKSKSKSENKSQIRHVEEYARKDNGTDLLQATKDKIDKMGLGALPSEIMKDKAYLKRLEKHEASLGSNISDLERKEIERSRKIHQKTIAYMEKRLAELNGKSNTQNSVNTKKIANDIIKKVNSVGSDFQEPEDAAISIAKALHKKGITLNLKQQSEIISYLEEKWGDDWYGEWGYNPTRQSWREWFDPDMWD